MTRSSGARVSLMSSSTTRTLLTWPSTFPGFMHSNAFRSSRQPRDDCARMARLVEDGALAAMTDRDHDTSFQIENSSAPGSCHPVYGRRRWCRDGRVVLQPQGPDPPPTVLALAVHGRGAWRSRNGVS